MIFMQYFQHLAFFALNDKCHSASGTMTFRCTMCFWAHMDSMMLLVLQKGEERELRKQETHPPLFSFCGFNSYSAFHKRLLQNPCAWPELRSIKKKMFLTKNRNISACCYFNKLFIFFFFLPCALWDDDSHFPVTPPRCSSSAFQSPFKDKHTLLVPLSLHTKFPLSGCLSEGK